MQQHGSKYFVHRPPPTPDTGVGSNGLNSPFSEHGHVGYQIQTDNTCSNIVASILPQTPPPHTHTPATPDPGVKTSKFNLFRTWSCCISNLME